MTNPRYRPRNYTTEPTKFGRIQSITWIDIGWRDYLNQDRLLAAQTQHHIAVTVRRTIASKYPTMRAYTRRHHLIDYDQLSSLLRGDTIMRLEHIAAFQRTLNLQLTQPAPE